MNQENHPWQLHLISLSQNPYFCWQWRNSWLLAVDVNKLTFEEGFLNLADYFCVFHLFSRPVTCGWPTQRWSPWTPPPSLRLVLCSLDFLFRIISVSFEKRLVGSESRWWVSPPSSSSFSVLFFCLSVSLLWDQALVWSIFVSPCGFTVNCFQLITRSLTHCSSLLSSFPAAAAAAVTSPSFASPHPSTPLFTLASLSSTTSPSPAFCLVFSLGVPGAERVQLGSGKIKLSYKKLAQHAAYVSFLRLYHHELSDGRYQAKRESVSDCLRSSPPDIGLRRYESWVGGQRLAAQPGPSTVPQLLHGVPGRRPHAGPPDQEGAERAAQDGGQLSQVSFLQQFKTLLPSSDL